MDKRKKKIRKKRNHKTDEEGISQEEGDEVDFTKIHRRIHFQKGGNFLPAIAIQKDEFLCLTARTALLLPFKWSDPTTADLGEWINEMLKRRIVTNQGNTIALYEENKILPDAVADLDPHFSKTLGWNDYIQKGDDDEFEPYDSGGPDVLVDEVCRRVIVHPTAMETLFPSPGLVANQSGGGVTQRVHVEEIEIVGFPLGTAVLKFILNWIPGPEYRLTIDEFRTWLYLSKFRHKVEAFDGWILDCDPHHDHTSIQQGTLGSRLCNALYHKTPLSLTAVGNWLLMNSLDSPSKPPERLGRFAKRCYHHTVVVIDRQPEAQLLTEYLFHLKRAYGQKNRPPPFDDKQNGLSADMILRPRSNRYIGMSREGTVSLSWPSNEQQEGGTGGEDYEVRRWPKIFLAIYLILSIQIQGEKAMLLELSNLSAHAGSLLKKFTYIENTMRLDEGLQQMAQLRSELGALAALMTRYTLQMSSDDCGGLSEYVEFFSAQRSIFGIRNQRSELREEIQDVLALVESSYLEEQRKLTKIETNLRKEEKRQSKYRDDKIAASQAGFQNTVAVVSIFTLPVVLLGSIFGMNLTDLPIDVPFFPAMAFTLSLSIILVIIFIIIMYKSSKSPTTVPANLGPRVSLSLDGGERSYLNERFSLELNQILLPPGNNTYRGRSGEYTSKGYDRNANSDMGRGGGVRHTTKVNDIIQIDNE